MLRRALLARAEFRCCRRRRESSARPGRGHPLATNARLGRFTNFANLPTCACAAPAGFVPTACPSARHVVRAGWPRRAPLKSARRSSSALRRSAGAGPPRCPSCARRAWSAATDSSRRLRRASPAAAEASCARSAACSCAAPTAPGYRLYRAARGPPERPALVRAAAASVSRSRSGDADRRARRCCAPSPRRWPRTRRGRGRPEAHRLHLRGQTAGAADATSRLRRLARLAARAQRFETRRERDPARAAALETRLEPGPAGSHVLKRGTTLEITDLEGGANVSALFYHFEIPASVTTCPTR